jgi:hypothetical protein
MRNLKAIKLSESALEQLSKITPAAIEMAKALWSQTVPLRWKPLLDAQTIGIDDPLTSVYVWDATNRRYIHLRSRRYVPFQDIRAQAVEPLIQRSKAMQRTLSQGLQSGDTKLSEWQLTMLENIKQTELAASLAANGGEQNTSEADKKKIAAAILLLLLFFQTFTEEIEVGRQALNGSLLARSDLYANSARSIFEETRRFGMAAYFGAVQERRRFGIAEHCHSDGERQGCVELYDKGWQPINSLPRLGDTPCRTNCKCRFEYRYKDNNGDWVLVDDSKSIAVILKQLGVREDASTQSR